MCLKIFLRINNWHAPSALLFTYFWGLLSKITSMETMHVFVSYCNCWMLSSLMFQCLWPTNTSLVWCDQMRWKQWMYLTTIDIVCYFRIWWYSNAFDPQIFSDLPHPPWIWYNLIFNITFNIPLTSNYCSDLSHSPERILWLFEHPHWMQRLSVSKIKI